MSEPTKCPFCGAESANIVDTYQLWHCGTYTYDGDEKQAQHSAACMRVERKALKARIARMERAGDRLATCAVHANTATRIDNAVDEWRKAKPVTQSEINRRIALLCGWTHMWVGPARMWSHPKRRLQTSCARYMDSLDAWNEVKP